MDAAGAVRRGVGVGLATLALLLPVAAGRQPANPADAGLIESSPRFADIDAGAASDDVRHVADWVADTHDNAGARFFVVDKKAARLYAFAADARLLASAPVLLGAAHGDHSVPGIGDRPMEQIRPDERTTPAGRFLAQRGRNTLGEDVVWIDYAAAVSMHRVRTTRPEEQRLHRLATASSDDNRISYGCINVPVVFYETYLGAHNAMNGAVVYVLPERDAAQQVFGSYGVAAVHGLRDGRHSTEKGNTYVLRHHARPEQAVREGLGQRPAGHTYSWLATVRR